MSAERLDQIPVVALKDLQSTGEARQEAVDITIGALHDIGFVFVATPGIEKKIATFYPVVRKVFALPQKTLMRYAHPEIHYQRGYTPLYKEIGIFCQTSGPDGIPEPDIKENWFIGPEEDMIEDETLPLRHPILHAKNIWPEEVPEFEEMALDLRTHIFGIVQDVFTAIEEPLKYEPGYFRSLTKDSPTSLRPLHYPAVAEGEKTDGRGGCPHNDLNLGTGLIAPTKDGLWVQTRDRKWIKVVAPDKGFTLVQVGDQLEYLTGGEFTSALHKVDAPVGDDRYSAALFVHANADADLAPGPQWNADPEKYIPITAAEHVNKRLHEINLAKQQAREAA